MSSRTDILLELSAKPVLDQQEYSVMILQCLFLWIYGGRRFKLVVSVAWPIDEGPRGDALWVSARALSSFRAPWREKGR